MVQSLLHTAPHVTTVFEADMSAVIAHRAASRPISSSAARHSPSPPISWPQPSHAIRAVPEANSRWTDSALEIYDGIDIGIATALDGSRPDRARCCAMSDPLDLFGIARELERPRHSRARRQADSPRTFAAAPSRSRITASAAACSPRPSSSTSRSPRFSASASWRSDPWYSRTVTRSEERIVVRPKCYVTLTIDHRVMDGHQANRFLQTFVRTLEAWPAD